MKCIILPAIICLISLSALAQPTLTALSNNPVAGDIFAGFLCDTTGYSSVVAGGASGAGVTWNFDSLVPEGLDTLSFTSSAGTLYIDSFPGSNLLYINRYFSGHTQYLYYTTTTNWWGTSGSYDSNSYDKATYFEKPEKFISYPLSYGAAITVDTMKQSDPTTQHYITDVDSNIADAYGTLITPGGTYLNVLRVHQIVYETDSTPGLVSAVRSDGYYWFQPGFHYILMNMEYDTTGGNKYLSYEFYYTQIAESITTINKNDVALEVSPNPAADIINLKFTITDPVNTSITLSDITGRTVGTVSGSQLTAGLNNIQYPVSALPPGVYFIRLNNDGNSVVKKVVVER